MLSNTDITINEGQTEADELQAEAAALSGGDGKSPSHGGRIARAAIVLMAGTILSRVVGVGRESSIAYLFGGGVEVGAFTIANHVATIVYDLLIAGTVSAALVPVLSEYAQREDQRAEFGKVLGTVMTVAALFLLGSVAVLEVFAEPLAGFMSAGYPDEARALALVMTQWVLPGVFFMGMSGIVMAALYALNRFVYPAFTSVLFNLAIIACAFALAGLLGVKALALGLVVGAVAMLVFQLPGLRDVPLRPSLDMGHPAVRKIMRLYAPVGLSVIVSSIALVIDRNLASQVGGSAIGAMRYATTLVQFGLGMVAAAISLAALPSLSQHFSNRDAAAYNRTLATGLRLVTVMVLPAAAMLLALAVPLVNLLFFHGAFTQADANLTVLALMLYVIGLPFSAIDQVLLFAFYARKNTLTPALIGVAQFAVYLVIAFATYRTWGMPGLVIANSAQLAFHALVTAFFLWRAMRSDGGLGGHGIVATALKAAAASAALGLASYATWWALSGMVPGDSIAGEVVLLGVPALVGGAVYAALVWSMRLPEVELVLLKVRARLGRGR